MKELFAKIFFKKSNRGNFGEGAITAERVLSNMIKMQKERYFDWKERLL